MKIFLMFSHWTGRIHRIGQRRETVVHRFLILSSIEQKMHSMLHGYLKSSNPGSPVKHEQLLVNNEIPLTLGDMLDLFEAETWFRFVLVISRFSALNCKKIVKMILIENCQKCKKICVFGCLLLSSVDSCDGFFLHIIALFSFFTWWLLRVFGLHLQSMPSSLNVERNS